MGENSRISDTLIQSYKDSNFHFSLASVSEYTAVHWIVQMQEAV